MVKEVNATRRPFDSITHHFVSRVALRDLIGGNPRDRSTFVLTFGEKSFTNFVTLDPAPDPAYPEVGPSSLRAVRDFPLYYAALSGALPIASNLARRYFGRKPPVSRMYRRSRYIGSPFKRRWFRRRRRRGWSQRQPSRFRVPPESKYLRLQVDGASFAPAGAVTCLNAVATGDAPIHREGRKIFMTRLSMKWVAVGNASQTQAPVRIIVFLDHNPSGTTPAVSDVLTANTTYSNFNYNQRNKFEIVRDFFFDLSATAGEAEGTKCWSFSVPLNTIVTYNEITSAATSLETNGLYVLTICDEATNVPAYSFSSDIRFTDV